MLTNERHNQIIELLKKEKGITVEKIAKKLYVSNATIRRDLNQLKTLGLVERTHGGAVLCENADEISIFVRMAKNAKEKAIIAQKTLPFLPAFHSLFIDSSSTALALAEKMDLQHKTVVTNNLQSAILLSKKQNVNLILLGGNVQYNTVSTTGSWTARQLENFSFDLMICSCASVTKNEVLERSLEQKEIKQVAFNRSKKRILLLDSSKIDQPATYKSGTLSDYDLVVMDANCPQLQPYLKDINIII